jgi:hypothetical protein
MSPSGCPARGASTSGPGQGTAVPEEAVIMTPKVTGGKLGKEGASVRGEGSRARQL